MQFTCAITFVDVNARQVQSAKGTSQPLMVDSLIFTLYYLLNIVWYSPKIANFAPKYAIFGVR